MCWVERLNYVLCPPNFADQEIERGRQAALEKLPEIMKMNIYSQVFYACEQRFSAYFEGVLMWN